jgi:PAS domain S-box-containing protein
LRGKAEERLRTGKARPATALAEADARALVHELQVLQIELEMQNEELLRAHTATREASEKYYNLFDFAPVGCFLWDAQGRILEVNLAGAALLGLDRSAVIQKRFGQFVVLENRPAFADFCHRVLTTDDKQTCEVQLLNDGRPVCSLVEGIAAHDLHGQGKICRAAVIDITERKLAEDTLRRYELLAGHSRDIILFMRRDDGRLLEANAAAVRAYGYSREELLALTIHNLQAVDTHGLTVARMIEADKHGVLFATRHCRKNGTEFPVEVSARGAVIGNTRTVISVVRDIGERRKQEEELQRAQAQLTHMARLSIVGEMVASIAHEVNKPIYSIANYAKACNTLLAKDTPELSDLRDWVREIMIAASRTGAIIARLLHFSRRSELQRIASELHDILNEAIDLAAFEILSTCVVVKREFVAAHLMVEVDRVQIQQVVANLLQNACQELAMRPLAGRQVTIRTAQAGDFIAISVIDNGPGIAVAAAAMLFEPFFTTKPEGLGMGLAISKSIIEAHGGRIWATANEGQGATFHFTLPKAAKE